MLYIDGVKQNEKELIKLFGLDFRGRATFELMPELTPPDKDNGGRKVPKSVSIMASFMYYDEKAQQDKEMRWSEGVKKVSKDINPNLIEYTTRKIEFKAGQRMTTKADLFIFLMLNPKCADSQFTTKGMEKTYRIKDSLKIAKTIEDDAVLYSELVLSIRDMSSSELRARALGMPREFKIGANANLEDSEVRANVYEAAKSRGTRLFQQSFLSQLVYLKGLTRLAISNGVVESKNVDGRLCFVLNKKQTGEQQVLMVIDIADPNPEMLLEQKLAENSELFTSLREEVSNNTVEKELKKSTSKGKKSDEE